MAQVQSLVMGLRCCKLASKTNKPKAGEGQAGQYLQGWWKRWKDPFGYDGDGHSVGCGDDFTDVHIPLISKLFKLYALNTCS